jgi:hypothetical protein
MAGDWTDLRELVSHLEPTPVPNANMPLRTKLLHADSVTRASCLLVEFPVGWKRTAGVYSCAEHAIVLSGSVILDGEDWSAGHGFVVPAGELRTETFTPKGALAVAWFGGVPRWNSSEIVTETGGKSTSGQAWLGDHGKAERDETDPQLWRWRHVSAPTGSAETGIFSYRWPTP